MAEIIDTIWVCRDCVAHHANGECGSCHRDFGHDEEPLGLVEPGTLAMGMDWEGHGDDCLTRVTRDLQERLPDLDWPDVPDDYECECETNAFSTSQCEGCGSYLHGERHAMTLFES